MKIATTKDRIIEYLDSKNIKLSEFYANTGLKRGLLDKDKLDQSISDKFIATIIEIYKDLNLQWLITGKGEMLKSDIKFTEVPTINYNQMGAPYYDVDFTGSFDVVVNNQQIAPDYYINFEPFNINGAVWCNITGKSMAPEINNGDKVIIQEVKNWQSFMPYGEIYGIVTQEFRTIKRVRKSPNPNCLLLVPTNPDYDPQEICKNEILAVYKILGSVKLL